MSYLQPAELRPDLLTTIATTPGVAPYFDLSFQHASPAVLRRMRRFGSTAQFLDLCERIRALAPEAGIRSNVIVGFPGETDDDVAELEEFLTAARLDAVGVFGYSDEDGTEAAGYDGKVPTEEVAARVSRIAALVDELMAQRAEDRVGTEVTVLVDQAEDDDFECTGRAEHQAPEVDGECVLERGSGLEPGDLVRCVVTGTEGADLLVSPREVLPRRAADAGGSGGVVTVRSGSGAVTSPAAGAPPLLNIANVLTGVRLLLVPVFLVTLFVDHGQSVQWRLAAFGVFAVAAFTDRLDGQLARSRGLVTAFGTVADPIADKALTGSALVGLSVLGMVPWWATLVMMGREIAITLLRFAVLRHGIIPASRGGKAKTLVQAVAIGFYLLPLTELFDADTAVAWLRGALLGLAVLLTVVTGVDYVLRALRLRATAPAVASDPSDAS